MMKKTILKRTAVLAAAAVLAGCLSYQVQSVTVSAEGNAAAMKAGETLQFSSSVVATGKDLTGSERVNWTVSSTEDGKGSVTPGTSISPSGLLEVSVDEIYPVIWVKAASAAYSKVYDFRQLQISGPKVGSVTLTSAGNAASVPAGGTLKFTAVAAGRGPNQGITFSVGSVSGVTGPVAAGTSIASDGTLTVAAGETANSLFVRAVSETDTTKTDTKEVKVVTVTSVTVSADGGTAKVVRGGSLQFSAAVAGKNDPPATVTWKVSATADGTGTVTSGTSISGSGNLTVASSEAAATLYVTATSTLNTTKSGTITVVIPTVTGVAITPASPQIKRGDGLSFKATVQGTGGPGQDVTWTVEGIGGNMTGSTMTSNGILTVTINEMMSRLLVTATSVDDPTKSGTATVTIAASPAGVPPVVASWKRAETNNVWGDDGFTNAVAYGGGKFVVGGQLGRMVYSQNGITWTAVANSTFTAGLNSSNINAIAYGGGKFVAGGGMTQVPRLAFSQDGITWTTVTTDVFGESAIKSIAYGGGRFVAGTYHGRMAYSTDGITWTAVANTPFTGGRSNDVNSIAHNGSRFIAVGYSGKVVVSNNGETWTQVTVPTSSNIVTNVSLYTVAWGKDRFIVGGSLGVMSYSQDGTTNWTAYPRTADAPFGLYTDIKCIAYGNNRFVAVGHRGIIAYLDN
ncbi:MAG: hypothetical protein LBU85_06620 [Treponema sp.]|jgi:hypothetical protein|nr:hypothetical protein [Treponema sp.]